MLVVLQIPNGFGFGLGTVQLILYAIYCDKKGLFTKKSTPDDSLEIGNEKSNGKSKLEQV